MNEIEPKGPSAADLAARERCEQVIRDGVLGFRAVGEALFEIMRDRLWVWTHRSFEQYCEQEWHFSKPWTHKLMDASFCQKRLETLAARPESSDVKMDNKRKVDLTLITHLSKNVETLAALHHVSREHFEKAVNEAAGHPKLDLKAARQIAAKYTPERVKITRVAPLQSSLADELRSLASAAELLAELAEVQNWTYPRDQRLAATIQALRISYRKLRKLLQ